MTRDKRYGPGARAMAKEEPGTERKKIYPGKGDQKPKTEDDPGREATKPVTKPKKDN